MASARAKLRDFLAWVRSAMSLSMSASVSSSEASRLADCFGELAFLAGPVDGFAGDFGIVVFDDVEDLIELPEHIEDGRGVLLLQLAVVGGGVGVAD